MDRASFTSTMLLYRTRLEGALKELARQREFEAVAETQSPRNIVKSYAMGLDAIQNHFRGQTLSNFDRVAEQLIIFMNDWIARMERLHYDYIRAMKNPDHGIKLDDVLRAIEYAGGVSVMKVAFDFITQLANGFLSAQPDLKRMASYLASVLEFEDQVRGFVYGPLWDALKADAELT